MLWHNAHHDLRKPAKIRFRPVCEEAERRCLLSLPPFLGTWTGSYSNVDATNGNGLYSTTYSGNVSLTISSVTGSGPIYGISAASATITGFAGQNITFSTPLWSAPEWQFKNFPTEGGNPELPEMSVEFEYDYTNPEGISTEDELILQGNWPVDSNGNVDSSNISATVQIEVWPPNAYGTLQELMQSTFSIQLVGGPPQPPALTLGSLSPTRWQVHQPGYDGTIAVTGGSGAYKNLQVSGLPSGLSFTVLSSTVNGQQSGTITIGGTPTQSGTFILTTTVQDGNGDTVQGTETLTITPAPTTTPSPDPTPTPTSMSAYPTPQPNYGVAPLSERVRITTAAQRRAWEKQASQLKKLIQSYLPAGHPFRVTSVIKAGEHSQFEKMDVATLPPTTWSELAYAAYKAGFWVHAEDVTLGGKKWSKSAKATGPHLDLYYLRN